jgi:hypothetical protein
MATTTITNVWLRKVADAVRTGSFAFDAAYFRIGEGGWDVSGGVQAARVPDPSLVNIDCIQNPSRYPANSVYYFQKSFTAGNVVEVTPYSVRIECFVDTTEANDDGTGVSPEFWEIGVFDSEGTMISYTTFDRQPKDDSVALRHYINIQFALG